MPHPVVEAYRVLCHVQAKAEETIKAHIKIEHYQLHISPFTI